MDTEAILKVMCGIAVAASFACLVIASYDLYKAIKRKNQKIN